MRSLRVRGTASRLRALVADVIPGRVKVSAGGRAGEGIVLVRSAPAGPYLPLDFAGRERREVCGVWQRAVKTIGDRERLLSEERMRDQRLPSVLPEYDDLWRALLNPTGLVLILLQGEGSSEAFFC